MTWWDANGDGLMDIYVGNDMIAEDRLYMNMGNGKPIATTTDPRFLCNIGKAPTIVAQKIVLASVSAHAPVVALFPQQIILFVFGLDHPFSVHPSVGVVALVAARVLKPIGQHIEIQVPVVVLVAKCRRM